MLTMKQFLEAAEYRITEGTLYCWDCYGSSAFSIDSFAGWGVAGAGPSSTIIFDLVTQQVYEIQVVDSKNDRAYRTINPEFKAAYDAEADRRGVAKTQCYDEVNYIDLDVDEDMLEKLTAIMRDEEYDTRVMITLELTDEEARVLAEMAIEQNTSVDAIVEDILAKHITFLKLSEEKEKK